MTQPPHVVHTRSPIHGEARAVEEALAIVYEPIHATAAVNTRPGEN